MIKGEFYGYALKDKAAFGVNLHNGDITHSKTFKLKVATVNAAELHALEYALKAIADPTVEVELVTCNSYVPRLMVKDASGKYKAKPEKNVELVNRVREAADKFTNLKVTIVKSVTIAYLQSTVRKEVKTL